MSFNENAIHLLAKNLEKVDWFNLSFNPNGVELIKNNLDKLRKTHWGYLCQSPNALELLANNPEKIDYVILANNPSIFVLDSTKMRNQCRDFAESLAAYVFHPERIEKIATSHNMEFDQYMDLV